MSEQNAKKDKPYFPLFVDLSDRDILFAGGGRIAARRIGALQPFAEHITVVSPEAEDSVQKLAEEGSITWICRNFEAEIADLCRQRQITVNASSDKELCDFYFPGIVRQGETVIGINASGRDHRKARRVRERIQELLTEEEI